MRIRIEAVDLPGERFGMVGVQRRQEVVDTIGAGSAHASWLLEADVVQREDDLDLRGPYVHGRRGDRFLYLSWGADSGAGFTMYRRAKLMLDALDSVLIRRAAEDGVVLVGRLGLTAADGTPRCAAVRPPVITWSVEAEAVAPR